jgi:hypothetical protein
VNDIFEENAELIQQGKSKKEAHDNKDRLSFFVPEETRWSATSSFNSSRKYW